MFEDVPSLEDLGPLYGRSVLLRADLNVPLSRAPGRPPTVADDFRIRAALPTITWLMARGARVTVASHLGRPRGHPDPALSLEPVRVLLEHLVPGVKVLENLRFEPGEEAGDAAFGAWLVDGNDCYVNDAFGACHRAHSSIVFPPSVVPSCAGRLLHAELAALSAVMDHPARPFTLVAGGAKVADKLGVIRALAGTADRIVLGGAMAFTFLAAAAHEVGDVALDQTEVAACRVLLDAGLPLTLPVDLVAARSDLRPGPVPADAELRIFVGDVPAGWQAFDVGPDTRARFRHQIAGSGTVLWNGPMGVFEDPRFDAGTRAVAEAVARCTGFTVVGGGDSVRAIRALGLEHRVGHLSSGGGAMLALIEQGDLPGIAALRSGRRDEPARAKS